VKYWFFFHLEIWGHCGHDRISWIYSYLYNQYISPLKLCVWIPLVEKCTRYNIMWSSMSVTYDRLVVYSGTLVSSTKNWQPQYKWNIVESSIKYQIDSSFHNSFFLTRYHSPDWCWKCLPVKRHLWWWRHVSLVYLSCPESVWNFTFPRNLWDIWSLGLLKHLQELSWYTFYS